MHLFRTCVHNLGLEVFSNNYLLEKDTCDVTLVLLPVNLDDIHLYYYVHATVVSSLTVVVY